jgi:hypothetical protein
LGFFKGEGSVGHRCVFILMHFVEGRWSLVVGRWKILHYERPGFIAVEPDYRIAAELRSAGHPGAAVPTWFSPTTND